MARKVVKSDYNYTKGLGLYLPKHHAHKWQMEHKIEDSRMVNLKMPLTMVRAIFETLAAMTAEDVGVLMGRYVGMNYDMANYINRSLNGFIKMMYANGMRSRLKPDMEPNSWKKSREMGWDDVKR